MRRTIYEIGEEAEERRLDALYALEIPDTPPEEAFDRITAVARFSFRVLIASIALIDRDRQWFKSQRD